MNTKLHAVTDANGRPMSFIMTAGQVSDYTGAAALLDEMAKAQWLLGDRGNYTPGFRDALQEKGISPLHPGKEIARELREKMASYLCGVVDAHTLMVAQRGWFLLSFPLAGET